MTMASRAALYLRSFKNQVASGRTIPATANTRLAWLKGDNVLIYVCLGLIMLAGTFGLHTARNQLAYNPTVSVSKKKRETVLEVDDPDEIVDETDRFLHKSFFRKVARVQDIDKIRSGITDPVRAVQIDSPHEVESLKSVGVETHSHQPMGH